MMLYLPKTLKKKPDLVVVTEKAPFVKPNSSGEPAKGR